MQRNEFQEIVTGILFLLGLHIVAAVILWFLAFLFSLSNYTSIFSQILVLSILRIGLTQLFYVIPLALRLKQQQKWGEMKGVIIGAVLTALLNGGCFLWISTLR